jgi:SAM-dependent methyltransferase
MDVRRHYEEHLARIYPWMAGDFEEGVDAFTELLASRSIEPTGGGLVLDLGAGHGIQSVALARAGWDVVAVDFSETLLADLRARADGLAIRTVVDDIRNVRSFGAMRPDLILCCGDTLTHLADQDEVSDFLSGCGQILGPDGRLVLSFRDYAGVELSGEDRFIPVISEDGRILTCVLEYGEKTVRVTDLLHEKGPDGWVRTAGTYAKVRIAPAVVAAMVEAAGMEVVWSGIHARMETLVARKSSPRRGDGPVPVRAETGDAAADASRPETGRPEPGEFAPYAAPDIDAVPGDDAVAALARLEGRTRALFESLRDAAEAGHTYAPGKWTLKEVLGHLADDERIFCHRILSVARGAPEAQPGFDEVSYVASAGFEERPLDDLLDEYSAVRRATLALLEGLPREAWSRHGTVNGYRASTRGLAFHIAGHELHHHRVIRDRYVPALSGSRTPG